MWRLIRFLLTGDGHLHQWKFTHVDYFSRTDGQRMHSVTYVKVCTVCGKHKTGSIYNCYAKTAGELNP